MRDNKCAQFGCLWALLPASVQQVVSKGRNENSITHLIHLVSATFKRGVVFPGIPLHASRARHARLFTLRSSSALARTSIKAMSANRRRGFDAVGGVPS